ncbi:MAG: hypothetical protein KGS61_08730, partial [Verrucomicrobia bacterium]|nr:hypothetical protein [Verrucomicrobiota bacterium]
MKAAWCLAVLGAGWLLVAAQTASRPLEHVQLFGREYVRLNDWARAYHFEVAWRGSRQELVLSNRWARLE